MLSRKKATYAMNVKGDKVHILNFKQWWCHLNSIFIREHFLFHLEHFLLMFPRQQQQQQG